MSIYEPIVNTFKALADPDRVRLLGLLDGQHPTVADLCTALDCDEATLNQHLRAMREVGLVNIRNAGQTRVYTLNDGVLKRFKQSVADIEHLRQPERTEPDHRWLDGLDLDEEARAILEAHTDGPRLTSVPTKAKKFSVVIAWLRNHFEMGRTYTEAEVNGVLREVNEDYAILRRGLIDEGYMEREASGRTYWRVR